MAFNGSGTFNQATAAVVSGTVISSTNYNTQNADFATGLSTAVCKDGQTTLTANIPFAGFKITGYGSSSTPNARTDVPSVGQVQDGSFIWCGTAGGTADALTLTPTPAITAYATGQKFRFISGASPSSSTVTLAVSGLTAKAAQMDGAAFSASVVIEAGKPYEALYDGTQFQLQKFSASTSIADGSITNAKVEDALKTQVTITAGENLADRDLIYQDVFNQRSGGATKWYKVDTDATGPVKISPRLGIALAAITSGNTGSAQILAGRVSGFTSLTAGQGCWASSTAGAITQTEPAIPSSGTQNAVRFIGYAASTTEIDFDPDDDTTFVARNSALASGSSVSVQHFTDSGARERIARAYITTDALANTLSTTLDADFNNSSTYAVRNVILSAAFSASGTSVAITLRSASAEGLTFTTCRIQEKAASGNAWDFSTTGTTVTFSGADGGTISSNSTLTSDTISFTLDKTKNYVVSFYISGSGAFDSARKKTTVSGCTAYTKIGTSADASGTTPSGFSDSGDDLIGVETIQVAQTQRQEPCTIGSETVNSAATDRVTFAFSDTSSANQDTYTTGYNRTGATRDMAIEVTV